jgi:membrane dipeptidase
MPFLRIAMLAAFLLSGLSLAGPAAAQDLPPGEGREAVQAACTACHGVDVIVAQRRSEGDWNDVVARMIGNGATLTDDEYATVVHYLATALGPENPSQSTSPAQSMTEGAGAEAPAVSSTARAVHEAAVVLDTHFDTPALFSRPGWDIADRHDVTVDGSQVDLPRMIDGGVDGGFFAVYIGQGPRTEAGRNAARAAGLVRAMEIRNMVATHPDQFELATTADDATRIAGEGKRFVFMSMENAYPLASDPGMMQAFYALGVRMAGFAHFGNNDFADSATDTSEWHGLSPKGKALLAEMNRLGVIPDPSHSSDEVLDQVLDLSKTPVVLSHSGARAIFDHPRNVPDVLIRKLADKGGVIQLNAYNGYMIAAPENAERDKAMADFNAAMTAKYGPRGGWTEADVVKITAERNALAAKYPMPRANLDDLMKHLLHTIQLVGVDHVGLSGDFDGGGGIDGYNSVVDLPAVTERLLQAGYSKEDIAKIWGGNVLRVMRAVQDYAASQNGA